MALSPLKVLLVEDSRADAKLILHELCEAGFEPESTRVENEADFVAQLELAPDIILCDYSLPQFNALRALQLSRKRGLGIPFIIVSGSIGEDVAVQAIQQGASDYLLKDRLGRLGTAVANALNERQLREAEQQAERALRESEGRFRSAFDYTSVPTVLSDLDNRVMRVNEAFAQLFGYAQAEMSKLSLFELTHPDDLAASLENRELLLSGKGQFFQMEKRYLHKDGHVLWGLMNVSLIRDVNGQPFMYVGQVQDITERKRADQRQAVQYAVVSILAEAPTLQEAVPRILHATCETIGWEVGDIWELDRSANVLVCVDVWHLPTANVAEFVNQSRRLTFVHGEELPGRVWATGEPAWVVDITKDADFHRADAAARAGLLGGFAFPIQFGSEVLGVVEFFCRESRQPDEQLLHMFASLGSQIGQFITRKRAERELQLFRALIDQTTDAIEVIDPETGRFLDVNERACASLGYTREDFLKLSVPDIAPLIPGPWEEVVEEHRLAKTRTIESQHRRKDGSLFPIEINLNYIHLDREYLVAVVRDITDRKRVERERDELLARLQLQIERMPLAYVLFDADFRIANWNPAAERILGYTKEEALGKQPNDLNPQSFHLEANKIMARLRAGDLTAQAVNENLRKDGRTITCEWFNTTLLAEDGQFGGLLCLGTDVSARREAEEALRMRDRAIHAVNQGILITDSSQSDNPITFASPGFLRLTGYLAEEVMGRNCRFLQGKDTDPGAVAQLRDAVKTGVSCTVELQNYRKDGTLFWNSLSISPVRDESGHLTHFVGVQADVTERRQLEDQFRQAQKMEAVGRLAGGVAHDFNNLLTIINGYGEMLLETLPAGDRNRDLIQEIVHAGERAAALTRQLLAFSRKSVIEPKVLDLKAVLVEVERMLRRVVGEDIQLTVTADPEIGAVKADQGQVEQVLLNLVVNARDAMPQGGQLTIELCNAALDEAYARTHPDAHEGPYVLLAVGDNGCGMDAATIGKVFEPFFTTKGERGTGLGLATVHGIIRQAGGHVAVYSEVGHGTTFKVYLPRVEMQVPLPRSHAGQSFMARGSETILLVEDEDGVRALVRQVLQSCGYTVLEARDGVEALRIAGLHHEQLDLLVTDVVMPRMSGRELSNRLVKTYPGLKVLFLSGYTDDAVVRHGILEAEVAFLQKPFRPAALARKVWEVLDKAAAPASKAKPEAAPEGISAGKSEGQSTRILLVDDHPILRAGIRKILQVIPEIEVVAEAGDGREAIALISEHPVDVVFMDIAMSGLNGLEATAHLTRDFPAVRVIILSGYSDEEHVWKALRAGAAGYVLKHTDAAEIQLALETVIRGESYITPAVSRHIVAEFIRRGGNETSSVELLTSRQREILQLLAEGSNTKEIARVLSISAKTVEAHRAQVMERLDIHDLPGLVRYAIRVGLIHPNT